MLASAAKLLSRHQSEMSGSVRFMFIPEIATLRGTIRTLSPGTRRTLVEGVHRVAHDVCAAHGLDAEVSHEPGYPVAPKSRAESGVSVSSLH